MDLTRFGLHRRPFPPTPDTASYYPASSHEEVLSRLTQAFGNEEGLALLVGGVGTGKTLLCHCLLERLCPNAATVFLTNMHISTRKDLLQAILYDLSLPYEKTSEQELRLRLTDFVIDTFAGGTRTLLVLDEAQSLSAEALEELRLLGNLEASQKKAVQILIVSLPSILDQMSKPQLDSFDQRLSVRETIQPLGLEEAIDYLHHQIRVAGGQPQEVFTEESLEMIARATAGIPRLLNQVGFQALLVAENCEAGKVDAEIALEAIAEIGLDLKGELLTDEIPNQDPIAGHGDTLFTVAMPPQEHEVPGQELNEELVTYRLFETPPKRGA
ncbi:MAG: ExeA family protein [Gemmataceae bacterium]